MARTRAFRGVVVGASAGGLKALVALLGRLPGEFPMPVLVAQHLHPTDGGDFADYLASQLTLPVTVAIDKEMPAPSHVYVAPANYHLLVERGGTLALSVDPKVNWSRPSIDVLFDSAARAWADATIGVILSGANADGAQGMKLIREVGGKPIAQDPTTADCPYMPQAAIECAQIDCVLPPAEIGEMLVALSRPGRPEARTQ